MTDAITKVKEQMQAVDSLIKLTSQPNWLSNKEVADKIEQLAAQMKASIAGYHSLQCAVAMEKNKGARERIKKQAVEFMGLFMEKE